jgi:hypothetical protein
MSKYRVNYIISLLKIDKSKLHLLWSAKDVIVAVKHLMVPCEQSPLVFLLGTARRSERDSAELVYILCGADNLKTWIIMRNFRFDTGFITGFDLNRKLLIKIFFWEIGSCLATFAHAQMNQYTQVLQSLFRFSVPCREEIREDFARRVI